MLPYLVPRSHAPLYLVPRTSFPRSAWERLPRTSYLVPTLRVGTLNLLARKLINMKRSTDRILTTHVGSLIRPESLIAFTKAYTGKPPLDDANYRSTMQTAMDDVVKRQVEVGIDIVNDGEFGKSSWANYILERISGFENRPQQKIPAHWLGRDRERFKEFFALEMPVGVEGLPVDACPGPISYADQHSIATNIELFKTALAKVNAGAGFLTPGAPGAAAFNGVNEFYAS